jgi:hypothetical protein
MASPLKPKVRGSLAFMSSRQGKRLVSKLPVYLLHRAEEMREAQTAETAEEEAGRISYENEPSAI